MKGLIERLNTLPARLMDSACRAAAQSAAHAAQLARDAAPVDTGELKASIAHAPAKDGAVVTASAPHAAMVELGTSRMPPRPYMLPAARAVAEEYFRTVGEEIK